MSVTESYERCLRRLVEHEKKLESAVGVYVSGVRVQLWTHRFTAGSGAKCCKIAAGRLNLFACERVAKAVLGKSFFAGKWRWEDCYDGVPHARVYAVPLFGHEVITPRVLQEEIRVPGFVRWFKAEGLAAGIGHDGGRVTLGGFSIEPVFG